MNPERFQEVARVVREARRFEREHRAAFLDWACEDDPPLRVEVQRLLDEDGTVAISEPGDVAQFKRPASAVAHEAPTMLEARSHDALPIPERIGSYHVRHLLDAGGMGRVYIAVQEHPRRTVAVKVLQAGVVSPSAIHRFEYESQILARLQHPHIAQVYEAGTFLEGGNKLPYFAMEYVANAKPLTEHAKTKGLGTRERLELFLKVCDAMDHGHQKGIIHRDLKPTNILVDSRGEPKIIDFGVARATDSDLARTTLQTDVGQLIGTLQYMSPEQCDANPHDLDTRTDVYSLGVVLYELLCEQLPYTIGQRAIVEAARVIKEEAPTRPSTVNRRLRGDAETITLKALEKDRDRRYASAGNLAEDIRHYLAGNPIAARPPTIWYLARKGLRRHRTVVAMAAVAVAIVLVQVAVSTIKTALINSQAGELRDEISPGTAELGTITALKLAIRRPNHDIFAGEKPDVNVLEAAALFCRENLEGRPELEADLRTAIGTGFVRLRSPERAEPHLRIAFDLRAQRSSAEADADLATTAHALGRALYHNAKYLEARERLDDAVRWRRELFGFVHVDLAESVDCLGSCYLKLGELDEAEKLKRAALKMREALNDLDAPDMDKQLSASWNNLATCLLAKGRFREPLEILGETRDEAIRLGIGGEYVARTLRSIAKCLVHLGRYEEADVVLADALSRTTQALGEDDKDTAWTYYLMGWSLYEQRDFVGGRNACDTVLRLHAAAQREAHPDVSTTRLLMSRIAIDDIAAGDPPPEVEGWIREARADRERRSYRDADPGVAEARMVMAMLRCRQRRLDAAEQLCREAARDLEVALPEHPLTAQTQSLLGRVLMTQGRFDEAEEWLQRALTIYELEIPADHWRVRETRDALLECFEQPGEGEST